MNENAIATLIFLIAVYFLPAIVASRRGHRNKSAIFALNLLLGWTLLGWVAAFVWSLTAQDY
ncbi:superinfection immunity protein [Xanthobacter autotrophicus]|uniref:superinfection immunity protein n=1 Tax=Xanthobacter autotrophicus TaxID=280 RepID=UPI003727E567